MNNITIFLEKYKSVESSLRSKGIDVKEYEDTLNTDDAQRLRLCRTLRNYISHNEDGKTFVEISSDMLNFIEKLDIDINKDALKIKDIMEKKALITEDATFIEASKSLDKFSILVIVDSNKEFVGLFTDKQLRKMISDGKTTKACKVKDYAIKPKIQIKKYHKDTLWENVEFDGLILVTSNGNDVIGLIKDVNRYNRSCEDVK